MRDANLGLSSASVECGSDEIKVSASEILLQILKLSTFLLFPSQKFCTQNPLVTERVRTVFNAFEIEVPVSILSWHRPAAVSP